MSVRRTNQKPFIQTSISPNSFNLSEKNCLFVDEVKQILVCIRRLNKHQQNKSNETSQRLINEIEVKQKLKALVDDANERAFYEYHLLIERLNHLSICSDTEGHFYFEEMIKALRVFQDENYQKCLIMNRKLVLSFDQYDEDIRRKGTELIKELSEFKKRKPHEMGTVNVVLNQSYSLLHQQTTLESYEFLAKEMEGKPSYSHQALGHAMKGFAVALISFGFVSLILGAIFLKPSFYLSGGICLLGLAATSFGFASWHHGKENIEKGRRKGISEKMGLFAKSVRQKVPATVQNEILKDKLGVSR